MIGYYGLVGREVIGPFDLLDPWYEQHAGYAARRAEHERTGVDPWVVAYDELPTGQSVSTVFLGVDHQIHPAGPPLLFETMVFPQCEVVVRTSTWEQAEREHRSLVAIGRVLAEVDDE